MFETLGDPVSAGSAHSVRCKVLGEIGFCILRDVVDSPGEQFAKAFR